MAADDVFTDEAIDELLRDLIADASRSRDWERVQRARLFAVVTADDSRPAAVVSAPLSASGDGVVLNPAMQGPQSAGSGRRWMAVAALVALFLGGVAIASRAHRTAVPAGNERPTPTSPEPFNTGPTVTSPPTTPQGPLPGTAAPAWPALFPALGLSDPDQASVQMGVGQLAVENPPTTSALVARVEIGRIVDGVRVSALSRADFEAALGRVYDTPADVVVNGTAVTVFTPSSGPPVATVFLPAAAGRPNVAVTGLDPIGFLELAGNEFGSAASDPPVGAGMELGLTIGKLPAGYTVVVPPEPLLRGAYLPTMTWRNGPFTGAGVQVVAGNPLLGLAPTSELTEVRVGALGGWATSGPNPMVVWEVSPGTWAQVTGSETVTSALQLAARAEFVDEATWRARYPATEEYFVDPSASSSTDAGSDRTSTTSAATTETPPIAVGESLMLGAADELRTSGFDVDAIVSVQGAEMADEIGRLRAAGRLGSVVAIQTGSNGPITAVTLDRIMSKLPPSVVPTVVFLTVHAGDRQWIQPNNELIRALPDRYPNVTIADWDALVTNGGVELGPDDIHVITTAAKNAYVELIRTAIGQPIATTPPANSSASQTSGPD